MSDRILQEMENPNFRILDSGEYKVQYKEGGLFGDFIANHPQRVLHFLAQGSKSMDDFVTDVIGHRKSEHTDWLEKILPILYPEPLVTKPHYDLFILKGRQLGITTYYYVTELDTCITQPGTNVGIIHIAKQTAERQLRGRLWRMYQHLDESTKQTVGAKHTASDIYFRNGSWLYIASRLRGETLNRLHVSEFAPKCAHNMKDAEEVLTGSMEAIKTGRFNDRVNMIVNETTMKDRADLALDVANAALENVQISEATKDLNNPDPTATKLIFLPFYLHEEYVNKYVQKNETKSASKKLMLILERSGIKLRQEQKNYLFYKQHRLGSVKRRLEFPVYVTEALEAPSSSAVWYNELQALYDENNYIIGNLFDKTHAIHLAWDVGEKDLAAVVAFQSGLNSDGDRWFHFIRGREFKHLDTDDYAKHCQSIFKELDAPYGYVIFPTDSQKPGKLGKAPIFTTTQRLLRGQGRVVLADYMYIIDAHAIMRKHFPRFKFNNHNSVINAKTGVLARLGQYQWKPDQTIETRAATVHNVARNMADAVRYGVCMEDRLAMFDKNRKFTHLTVNSPIYSQKRRMAGMLKNL